MMQDIPSRSFERNMNHNYMILSKCKCDFFGKNGTKDGDYRVRMLLENNISGLLPITHRQVNGESRYYYEINSLQSLDRFLEKKELGCDGLKALLMGCVRLFERLEEYLLDGSQVIIKPEFIYINVERMEPYFVCYPDYEGDARRSFMEFIDELLIKIDHTDEDAVMLGYQVYRYTRNPNFVLSEIRCMIERMTVNVNIVNMAKAENKEISQDNNVINSEFSYIADLYEEKQENTCDTYNKTRCSSDIIGCILCAFIALSVLAVIACARVLMLFSFGKNQELYLFGALTMALMAAAIFFVSFIKKRQYDKKINELENDISDDAPEEIMAAPSYNEPEPFFCGETVCLESDRIEERVLRGRIDDKEVNISLNNLPMTIGKLAGVSDFVINDNTVSKMHARFEEHDGRVYLYDLNSTNGTVKNGELIAIDTPTPLEAGDKIRFGRASFTYC